MIFIYNINMKKLIHKPLNLIILFIAILFTSSVFAATIRDNPFYFDLESGVTSLKITYESSIVSAGQPWESGFKTNRYINDNKTVELVFSAGRHKTSQVADQFIINLAKSDSNMYNPTTAMDDAPRELNFFIKTTLEINGSHVKNSFYIAQGSTGFTTNSWLGTVGGSKIKIGTDNYFRVTTEDNEQYDILSLYCNQDDRRQCFSITKAPESEQIYSY